MMTQKVSKSSIKLSLFKLRSLAAAIVLFFAAQMGWGETYIWTGNALAPADNQSWDEIGNWNLITDIDNFTQEAATEVPGSGDVVYIYGPVTVKIDNDVSIEKLFIQSKQNEITSNFTTALSGSGSLTVTGTGDSIDLTRCAGESTPEAAAVIGTLQLNLPVTCAGTIQTHSGTTLEVNDELTTVNLVHSAYGDTPQTLLKVNGTLNVTNTLNLNANAGGATQLNVQSGKTVNAKKIIFGADDYNNTGVSSAIVNAGTIRVTEEFTIRNIDVTPYTGSGKIQLDGNGATFTNNYTGGTITITDLECLQSSIIAGSTNFTNITATGLGGNTLTINGSQTITGDFDLSGSSSSSKLNIAGSGSLSLTNPLIAEYLNFTGTGPAISSGTAYASNSTGTPDDWVVVSANQHVWNGANGSWGVAANWLSPAGTVPGQINDVIINSGSPVITSDVTVKSVTFNGTSGITVTDSGSLIITDATAFDTKITGSGKYIVDSGKTHTVSDTKALSINIENKGTIDITGGSLTASSFSGNGTINLSGGTTALTTTSDSTTTNAVVLTNTDATIQGNFEFASFTADTNMGGKTITLNNATVKASSISLKGSGDSSLLSLVGSGSSCNFDTTSLDAQFLSIDSNIVLAHYTTLIPDCVPTAGETPQGNWLAVLHNGWNIKALTSFEYTWTGNTSNDWNTATNWDTGYVPATDCKIIISSGTPAIPDTGTFAGGTLSIGSSASVTLGSINLVLSGKDKDNPTTPVTVPLSNAGTIIYTAAGRITDSSSNPINDTTQGTVKYDGSGTGNIDDFDTGTGDDYYNLVIEGNKKWSFTGSVIKIKNSISIASGAVCNVTENITLQAPVTGFDFQGSFTATSKNITLTPYNDSDDFVIPDGMQSKFEFTGTNKGWVYIGSDSYTGTIKFNTEVNGTNLGFYFPYKLRFKSNVELNANIRVTNSIWAEKNITGDGSLIFSGTGDQTFTTEDTFTYNQIVESKGNGSLSLTSNGTINSLSIINGKTTTFTGTPTINSFTAAANAGNIVFSAGGNITNTNNETIATSGNVTIDSSTTAMSVTGTYNQTAGTTTVKGANLSAANFNAANLVVGADATITTNSGNQSYGTINGTTANTEELTLAATSVTFNDNVGATSLKKLTINAPLTIGVTEKSISAGEIDFLGAISGDGKKLTVNSPIFKSTAAADNTITLSEIEFAADSTSINTSSQKLTFAVTNISGSGKTISIPAGSEVELADGIKVSPAVINAGTITCSGAATFKGSYSGTSATLTLFSGTTIFESNLDLSGTTFAHSNGTVQIGGTSDDVVTVKGPVAPQAFYDFETSRSLKILGDNTFNNFTANSNMGGKSISFEAGKTQTVNGKLSLSGADGSLLTLNNQETGSWNISCANEPTLQYLSVTNSTNNSNPAKNFVALNSTDAGGNVDWCFPNMPYKWTGGTSNVWTNTANWDNNVVPTKGANVEIAAGSYYPVLTAALDLTTSLGSTSYNGIITVDSGATFDISNQTVTAGSIVNNGTLRLTGVADQIDATVSNGTTTSTVEYYDDSNTLNSAGLAWGTEYQKLIINKPANLDSSAITVSDTTTITPGTGKDVSLNNSTNNFGGAITLDAGAVTLNSSNDITITANALADSLSVTCVDGKTININKITTSGAQTFDGAVIVASDTTLAADSTSLIYFKKTVTGNNSLIIDTANSQFDGAVSGLTSLTTAAAIINCTSIATAGDQIYGDATQITANTELSAPANKVIQFNGAVTGTTNNLKTSGDAVAEFNNSVNIGNLETNAAKINTTSAITVSGTQTYNGAVDLAENTNLSAGTYVTFKADVSGSKSLTVSGPIILDAASVTFTATEIDFDNDIAGSTNTLRIDSPTFKSSKGSSATVTAGQVELVQSSEFQSTTGITLNTSKVSGSTKTLTNSGTLALADGIEVETALVNTGALTCSGNATFDNDVNLSSGSFSHTTGTVTLTASKKTSGAPAILSGSSTFANLTISGNANITGSNIITGLLSATGLTGTITFTDSTRQTVGSLALSGNSGTGNKLNLTSESGTWIIESGSAPATLENLSVTNSNNDSGFFFTAIASIDHGNNTNWNFPGNTYIWQGGDSNGETDWKNAANWDVGSIPGKGSIVVIPEGLSTSIYPKLKTDDNVDIDNGDGAEANGTITNNGQLDLAGFTIKAKKITNNGTLRLTGVADQIDATVSNGTTTSTVEYYDDSSTLNSAGLAWGTEYKKLIINKPANLDGIALTVNDTTTISAGTGNTVSLNNASNVFTGHVRIGDSVATPTPVNAGAVTLKGTGTAGAAIYLENNVLVDSLTLNSNVQGGDLTITGPVIVNTASISTTGDQIYNNAVTISTNASFNAGAGNLIKFVDTVTGSGTPLPSVEIQTASSQFDDTVSNLASLTTAAANINCTSISTSGDQTYGGTVTLGANPSLTSGGNILFSSAVTESGTHTLTLTQASSTTFNGTVEITGLADDTAHNGTVTFNAGGTISNTVTFNTPQEVTFGNESTDEITFNSNLTHAAGDTNIIGTLNAATISLGTTSGTTILNGTINGAQLTVGILSAQGTITTTGSQAYNGTVELTDDLNITSTAASAGGITFASTIDGAHKLEISTNAGSNGTTFNGAIGATPLEAVSVTGPTKFHCTSITSTGNQTYDGAVTVQTDTTLTANDGQLIHLKNTVEGSGSEDLIIADANSRFDGAISNLDTLTTAASTTLNANISSVGSLSTASASINCESISTSGNQSYSGAISIIKEGGSTLKATGGTITFTDSSSVSGPEKLTLVAGTNNISFNGTVGSSTTFLPDIQITSSGITTFAKPVYITKFTDTSSSGNITFTKGGTITGVDSDSLKTNGIFTLGTSTDTDTTAPTLTLANDFTHIAGDTVIYGTLSCPGKDITLGITSGNYIHLIADNTILTQNLTSSSNVLVTGNLIISGTASGVILNAPITVSENIVMHSGAITANQNLSATKDILILGSDYSEQDSTTLIADEYSYTIARPAGWSSKNYTSNLPATKSATLSVAADKTIWAGKNFYANGTSLSKASGSGSWKLKVPDLTKPVNGFAEAYHSKITDCLVICADDSSDGSKAKLISLEDTDSASEKATNTNVDFGDFEIVQAYTVRDNVVYVEFNREIRYLAAAFGAGGPLHYSDGSYTAIYSDPDCQNQITSDITAKHFYIKAYGIWNTDATGTNEGTAASTDRNGAHHSTKPYLDFPRALEGSGSEATTPFILTDIWGKRLTNYSSRANGSAYDNVTDKTGPVLYSVRTGQELHTDSADESNVKPYDSHNFIEFRYSEQVDFVGSGNDTDLNNLAASENIQVTDSLGAVLGDITQENNLEIAGLGKIANGLIYTGRNGSADKYVNSLYRLDDYSIRLSIAGYVDGTVTDSLGKVYKNWVGYIEHAVQVSGAVNLLVDTTGNISGNTGRVKDRATTPNWQVQYANLSSNKIPNVDSAPYGLYGAWDISEPMFAIIRQNNRKVWEEALFEDNYQAEAIGNPNGGSTLDRVEFHLYDNTPAFADSDAEPEWFTEVGWGAHGSNGDKDHLFRDYSYAADIFGGARPFDSTASNRTTGGIRYSSIINSAHAFKYGIGSGLPENQITTSFDNTRPVYSGATSLIFTGASTPRRSAGNLEGLYFGLPLADLSLDVKTSFTVHFDESQAYITDLAGNRLRSKTISTIDRTPPSIDMTISPIGSDEIEIVFVKGLITDSSNIHYITNATTLEDVVITEAYEYLIGKCFDIITIDSTGTPATVDATDLRIDLSTPAKVWTTTNSVNSSFTHIRLKLSRPITLEDIETKFIRVIYANGYAEESVDLFTQKPGSRVTFIQDENGNNIQMYTAHAFSDYAVNAVNPFYAYDSALTWDDGSIISEGLWHKNTGDDVDTESWAVHDWNRNQKNYGTLPAGHTLAVVADSVSPDVKIYLANNPDSDSVSTQANKDFEFETPWRIWFPDITTEAFRSVAETNNTQYSEATGTLLQGQSGRLIFDIDSQITDQWSSGNQITFLFGLINEDGTPVTIMHSPELNINQDKHYLTSSTKMPLYALRQTDPDDFMSLDLWSFRLKDIVNQRGGVTVLNNVINSNDGEKVVIKVNQAQKGNLNVLVMTLDGNIIDYLQRGESQAGEHYYSWDGSNRKGKPVARGMYFIRVTGPGIDETRKVLVVK